MRNRKSDKITWIVCMMMLAISLLIPSSARASGGEGGSFDASEMIFGHIGDSYEWHFTNIGEKAIALPLPVILYSRERGEWFLFSSSRIMEGKTYNGFYLSKGEKYKGKLVEQDINGDEVRPLDISLTKNAFALLINSLLLILLVLWCARWYKEKDQTSDAPKGFVGLMEMMVSMVYEDVIKANIPVHVQRYAPYLLCAFFFIFLNNLIGLIPGSANLTGNIAITLVLALCTFLMVNIFANKEYWKEIFWADVPLWMKPVMAVVEFLGIFTKPIALMIRLFANIMAGHAALLALVSVIFITFSISSVLGGLMTPLTVLFCIFLDFLEVLVAFIQAYVFTMLSAVFIGLSQAQHHAE